MNKAEKELSDVVTNGIVQGHSKNRGRKNIELECSRCKMIYYGKNGLKDCRYCHGEMKTYKFEPWQKEVMDQFLKKYEGEYVWLKP